MSKKIQFVSDKEKDSALEFLHTLYDENLISPEKKTYLTDHAKSTGPFMGIEGGKHILDAASQIASHGMGFNPSSFFGVGHHIESWLNRADTPTAQRVRKAFKNFLQRQLAWPDLHVFFCNSGAEANEIALGQCFQWRKHKSARSVLAFRSSFHGRFLVALWSTWNPVKREPFQFEGYETVFAPSAAMDDDNIFGPDIPSQWLETWEQAASKNFDKLVAKFDLSDEQLKREVDSLLFVREQLLQKKIFAVTAEPMQCEGGDKYLSARFHQALRQLTKVFGVALIYDEVQTGVGLGGDFFWHRKFDLKYADGSPALPDYVVTAKKAQTAVVMSHHFIHCVENFSVASMCRGYIQSCLVDQQKERIFEIENYVREKLSVFLKKFNAHLEPSFRACGLAFAFDFKDKELLKTFINNRFAHGLLFYQAGTHTARYRLSLGYSIADLDFLFQQLEACLKQSIGEGGPSENLEYAAKDVSRDYAAHNKFYSLRLELLNKGSVEKSRIDEFCTFVLSQIDSKLKLIEITKENYQSYRDKIADLEKLVYEPARQTPIEKFDRLVSAEGGVALGIFEGGEMVAMACSAPLGNFPLERGVRRDPEFNNSRVTYPLALTIAPSLQGRGIGKVLKLCLTAHCLAQGAEVVRGRNRDRFAAAAYALNLSLGAYEYMRFEEDYPDDEQFRDAIYYSLDLKWNEPTLNLSDAIYSPLHTSDLSEEYMEETLPCMINKMTLSNFVSRDYLQNLKDFAALLPKELRHVYAASGQSECVDKITKVLWIQRKPRNKFLSFEGCFFGAGSFVSRSLSGTGEAYFDTTNLPFPTKDNWKDVIKQVVAELKSDEYHSVWIEPLCQLSMRRVPKEFLSALKKEANKSGAPLVFNDTASAMYRYDLDTFFASSSELLPDAAFSYLGGQMGVCYMKEELFANDPLLMISTWDGDEHSFAAFMKAVKCLPSSDKERKQLRQDFDKRLKTLLADYELESDIEQGIGWFIGDIAPSLGQHFKKLCSGRYLVCPSYGSIKAFLGK